MCVHVYVCMCDESFGEVLKELFSNCVQIILIVSFSGCSNGGRGGSL